MTRTAHRRHATAVLVGAVSFRTGPRKFHAAWAETNGHKVSVPPTVARELAPNGMPGTDGQSVSYAELTLAAHAPEQAVERLADWLALA